MKNYPLMVKLFVSLSLFVIIPLLVIASLSNYIIMSYSEKEISKSGIGKLKVAHSMTKLLTQVIQNDSIRLSLNDKLNNLYGMDDVYNALKNTDEVYLLYQFQTSLLDIVNTNSKYQSIYLYLENSNYIITNKGCKVKDEFEDIGWIDKYLEYKNLTKPISWIETRLNKDTNEYVMSYIYPLTPYTTRLRGALVVNVFENSLCDEINSSNYDEEGNINIISNDGYVISNVEKSLLGKNIKDLDYFKKIKESKEEEGYLISNIKNKKYLITYYKTDLNDWIYVGAFQLENLTDNVNFVKMIIVYATIFLLVFGLFISLIISRKLYNPVKKLVEDIKSVKGIDIIGNENEVTLLSNAFDTLIKQEAQLFSTIEKNKRNIKENHLLGLINGKDSNQVDINEIFTEKYFVCSLIVIDRFKDFDSNFSLDQQYYLKTVILNISEDVIGKNFICSGIVLERDKIIVIINSKDSNFENVLEILKENFYIIQNEVSKVIETTISICIGDMKDDVAMIKNSYQEAQKRLKNRFILGHGSIIYHENTNFSENKYFYPWSIEKHILDNLSTSSKEALLNSLNDFFNEIRGSKHLNYYNVNLILNQLLGSTIKYLFDLNISISKVFGNEYNIYTQLTENETMDEAVLWLGKVFFRIIEYSEKPKVDVNIHFEKIQDYIQQNYKSDISVNTLAEHVGLSYSHVRKIFNDETGENIVNYINNLRIVEAKRLLCQTNMNINDIAISLGYNNNQSFNRFFKKFVGITPGEYRSIKSG